VIRFTPKKRVTGGKIASKRKGSYKRQMSGKITLESTSNMDHRILPTRAKGKIHQPKTEDEVGRKYN
jgi:hypothetical protein